MSGYPIGTPGQAWTATEKQQWLAEQTVQRSYLDEVVAKIPMHVASLVRRQYGELDYTNKRYPLYALTSEVFAPNLPTVLVTGGVHGYETSGVQGALAFVHGELADFSDKVNFIIAPCVSPWGYETINRWNPNAVDPNRSFKAPSASPEAQALLDFVSGLVSEEGVDIDMHIDLHETTDTDNTEFRPALAARNGETDYKNWDIPDGFYLVADETRPELAFQQAIINAVKEVTHIAPTDSEGKIIGCDVPSEGIILYDKKALMLCAGLTDARFVSTTEVYPDSPLVTPEQCNAAQVAALRGALNYLLEHA